MRRIRIRTAVNATAHWLWQAGPTERRKPNRRVPLVSPPSGVFGIEQVKKMSCRADLLVVAWHDFYGDDGARTGDLGDDLGVLYIIFELGILNPALLMTHTKILRSFQVAWPRESGFPRNPRR